jgi:hypothetical protein
VAHGVLAVAGDFGEALDQHPLTRIVRDDSRAEQSSAY